MIEGSIKKSIIMFSTSILGMALGFLVSIFNSQILGEESFGEFKFIETAARFIVSIVTVGFFISLTRLVAMNKDESKEKKYIALFITIFGLVSIVGMLLYFIFVFINPYLFENKLNSSIWKYFFIVAAIIGAIAIQELLKGLHKITTLAIIGVLPLFLYLTCSYLLNKYVPLDIDWVLFLTYGISLIIVLGTFALLKPDFGYDKSLRTELLLENKTNGQPIYFGSLAGKATTHIAGFSIAYYLDTTQVGFFMLALTVCGPMLAIPSILGTVFFKHFVNMSSIPSKVYIFSILGTLCALLIFYSLIDYAILTFYKEAFLPVADIAKYTIIGFVFHGYGDLFNRFLGAKGKGVLLRNAAFWVGAVNILGYPILVIYFNFNGAILTKVFASFIYLIIMLSYYLKFIKKQNV
ncbi:MAG: lipopolysaccharide biosynthesis protein [Croceivirga sp.]